ncbi:BREX-2 system adenine-specific DNA-methyltransferase PglX [Rhodococcus sp. IEGM 1374]|uniref:BREX-2 system adenine-specific DNA-methyltransferase PglX n=1 Tax=Rhodococcus sp. IEGM 1374 TaxID=3082221 RepID=UPI0029556B50|nr:BREX-2 system adenine-specific DNA-methyltransferase PglX [Rhodococcus sp. IEGM 1374]MDV7991940.1 BREX-2 system adenine-specific DNA-methyltransferase PglX [Rhodococcus sp. IEGM 1374]
MIDSSALLADLKGQLKVLQADLKDRAEDPTNSWGMRLKEEYAEALGRERTGWSWVDWRDNEVDQAAVAWIVSTTFLRFCEDNDLLAGAKINGLPTAVGWIAGPGDRVHRAEENLTAYFRENPTHNRRHWLQQGFGVLATQPAGAALVDPKHNLVWTAEISPESATALIAFWRRTEENGLLVHDFVDAGLETRFLGDLYQDLSEHAKKTYALLQTPVFVEEFILDQTLTPAIAEFGLEGFKIIDPSCGSGHFLLGAFERLNHAWLESAPGLDAKERVRRAMGSVHGVDINPFAVAIARFRLTVAGLKAMGESSLVGVSAIGFRLAIGDSLLGVHGGVTQTFDFDENEQHKNAFVYDTEDIDEYLGILGRGQYHVVVGNPPYITPKDKALNARYRLLYKTAVRKYALSAPFMELLFRLAIRGEQGQGAGYVGQITSNSFMKREFGKKLIEYLFAGHDIGNPIDLTAVVDTSGAYIPGHGTPTVIIIGRRRRPVGHQVRAILGVRGEPGQPSNPAKGLVWTEIIEHIDQPDYNGRFITVADLDNAMLTRHPWSLTGGGAASLMEQIKGSALGQFADEIGYSSITGDDSFLIAPRHIARRIAPGAPGYVIGESIRDYRYLIDLFSMVPIATQVDGDLPRSFPHLAWLWRGRAVLRNRLYFGKTPSQRGLPWWDFAVQFPKRSSADVKIAYSNISTHFHSAIDRHRSLFNAHGHLVIPNDPDKAASIAAVLNSSTACFWLKQVSHDKGNGGYGGGIADQEWERFFEFTGTKLQQFPLPAVLPLERARALDALAGDLGLNTPSSVVERWLSEPAGSLGDSLEVANAIWNHIRERLIFEQEELDWEVYRLYGLIDEDLTFSGSAIDSAALGQRAFEIDLARRVLAGTEESVWFERHSSTPVTDLPSFWPDDYRALTRKRLDLMDADRSIRLLEKPEYKRRWATTDWSAQRTEALQDAVLDRLEDPSMWKDSQGPVARSITELADLLRADSVIKELARALTGSAEPDLAAVIGGLAPGDAVPFLAAYRYKSAGVEKYRAWQEVWALQRREDGGEKVTIPVPPKYGQADFVKPTYWRARGKLDVPKERFIAYPGFAREGDPTPVLGWAGWSHRDQALALAREIPLQQALGVEDAALVPLVAGLVELEPWLHQWHSEIEPAFGASPAAVIAGVVDQYLARIGTTRDQVTAWTPPAATRGRKASK